jgi:hypothetical protein
VESCANLTSSIRSSRFHLDRGPDFDERDVSGVMDEPPVAGFGAAPARYRPGHAGKGSLGRSMRLFTPDFEAMNRAMALHGLPPVIDRTFPLRDCGD